MFLSFIYVKYKKYFLWFRTTGFSPQSRHQWLKHRWGFEHSWCWRRWTQDGHRRFGFYPITVKTFGFRLSSGAPSRHPDPPPRDVKHSTGNDRASHCTSQFFGALPQPTCNSAGRRKNTTRASVEGRGTVGGPLGDRGGVFDSVWCSAAPRRSSAEAETPGRGRCWGSWERTWGPRASEDTARKIIRPSNSRTIISYWAWSRNK